LYLPYQHSWVLTVHQMDVETAFLNAKLDEEMYIKPLLGIEVPEN